MGDLFPIFKGDTRRSKCLFALALSQVTLTQSNQCAQMAYFRVAYSACLQSCVPVSLPL